MCLRFWKPNPPAQIGGLETALLNYKEDHATVSSELDAVLTYLDKLKPQCETKVMSARRPKPRPNLHRKNIEK